MANTVASLAAAQDGLIPYHLIAVGSNNATNLKTTSGIIGLVTVYNLAAAPAYIKFYDKATAPVVGTDVPVFVVMAPGNANGAGAVVAPRRVLTFLNGISFGIVTGIADTDNTGVAANNVVLSLGYL